jgi:hypothetical protein
MLKDQISNKELKPFDVLIIISVLFWLCSLLATALFSEYVSADLKTATFWITFTLIFFRVVYIYDKASIEKREREKALIKAAFEDSNLEKIRVFLEKFFKPSYYEFKKKTLTVKAELEFSKKGGAIINLPLTAIINHDKNYLRKLGFRNFEELKRKLYDRAKEKMFIIYDTLLREFNSLDLGDENIKKYVSRIGVDYFLTTR